jgi:hypothetical protein
VKSLFFLSMGTRIFESPWFGKEAGGQGQIAEVRGRIAEVKIADVKLTAAGCGQSACSWHRLKPRELAASGFNVCNLPSDL